MTTNRALKSERLAVIYHYFELDDEYRDNFLFFLNIGINNHAHYFIYISGTCSVNLPVLPNVEVSYIENKNFDFGAQCEFSKRDDCLDYDAYIFINSSMRGPFLPEYHAKAWQSVYTEKLKEKVVLVGSSINLLPENSDASQQFARATKYAAPFIHVQTTAYAMSCEAYRIMHNQGFYDVSHALTKLGTICYYELGLSQELLNKGYKIASLLPTYNEFCIEKRTLDYKNSLKNGDPSHKSVFYGRSASPFEILFVKTKRRALSKVELNSYTFTALAIAKRNFGISCDGLALMRQAHNAALSGNKADEKIDISLADIQKMLTQIKHNMPDVALQLKKIL
jgi:hypothetical protein